MAATFPITLPLYQFDRGTVKAAENCVPEEDADKLMNAVKGSGTDEDVIINVLANRSNDQIQEIKLCFCNKFGSNMLDVLEDDFDPLIEWRIRSLLAFVTFEKVFRDGIALNNATYGAGTDEDALVEVLGTRSYEERLAICEKIHGGQQGLIDRIKDDVAPSDFLSLLLTLITERRNESEEISAVKDAKTLFPTIKGNFDKLFAVRTLPHMREVFVEYKKEHHHSIEEYAKHQDYESLYLKALQDLILIVRDKHEYFARRLHEAMAGDGTDDYGLNRIITTRCEVDLVQIKEKYRKLFNENLEQTITGDTSSYYKKFLLALIRTH